MNRFTAVSFTALLSAYVILSPRNAQASFEEYLTGGRATGVDGAMTAASNDVFGLYYNPAGIAEVQEQQIGAYYGRLYGGLSDSSNIYRNFFGYVLPLKKQTLGISFTGLALAGLYNEQTVGLSYARAVTEKVSLGGTLNYMRKAVGSDISSAEAFTSNGTSAGVTDPVFKDGHSASGLGVDVGAQMHVAEGLTVGAMVRNLNEPTIAFGGAKDRAPRTLRLGVAKDWNEKKNLLVADMTGSRFTKNELQLHGGGEHWWNNGIGMRAGGGFGARDYRRLTAGFSYRMTSLQVDYGFMMPFTTVKDTMGTHQISLTFRFGAKKANLAPSALAPAILPPVAALPSLSATLPMPMTFVLSGGAHGLILFDTDKWQVNQVNAAELKAFLEYMKQHPRARAEIEGHTDNVASAEYNQRLSDRRSFSVRDYLVNVHGIEDWRLTAKGYGLTRPVADNTTADGRHQNRRVVATIVEEENENLGLER